MALMVGLLAVFAVPVVITGRNLADAFNACSNRSCGDLFVHYDAIMTAVNLTVAVPLIFGIFWGVSVIGRELETGTATLAWSQSVTRRNWVRIKLLWLFGRPQHSLHGYRQLRIDDDRNGGFVVRAALNVDVQVFGDAAGVTVLPL